MHFSMLFLVCSVWENALHAYKSGGNVSLASLQDARSLVVLL